MKKEILDILNNLKINNKNKKLFGEVFTPIFLINDLVDKLPKDVWKNPDLKWLDPASGLGNFPIIIYYRLMESLKVVFKNIENRSKHIIENMLYMVELNPINYKKCLEIFKIIDKNAKPNIIQTDFLLWETKMKYDIIIGNPPYNKSKIEKQTGSRAKNSLWDFFIKKSFQIIKTNGYLGFIIPANWRGLGSYRYIWDLLINKQLNFINIFSQNDGQKYFKVSSRFDIIIVNNIKSKYLTNIIDEKKNKIKLDLKKIIFLPNYNILNVLALFSKKIYNPIIHSYSSYFSTKKHISKVKNNTFIYPIVHTINKSGIGYLYTNTNSKGHFGIPKIILNFSRYQYNFKKQNDYLGKLGMSQISFGIPIKSKKEGDLILKAIETKYFKTIIAATKWGAYQTDQRMFNYLIPNWYKIINN